MSAQALALVLLAGLIHAGWNILAKKVGGDARFAFFTSVWVLIVWAPLGLWLGWGAVPAWGVAEWAVVAGSAVLHVLYFITLLRGYRAADLTVVYPLARGTGPLLSSVAAVLLLGEAITPGGALGVLAVVLGVLLITGGARLWRARGSPQAQRLRRRGLTYGLLTGVWIAGYTVIDGYAVKLLLLSPGPGQVVERLALNFGQRYADGEPCRSIKSDPEFIAQREYVLGKVFQQREALL